MGSERLKKAPVSLFTTYDTHEAFFLAGKDSRQPRNREGRDSFTPRYMFESIPLALVMGPPHTYIHITR